MSVCLGRFFCGGFVGFFFWGGGFWGGGAIGVGGVCWVVFFWGVGLCLFVVFKKMPYKVNH